MPLSQLASDLTADAMPNYAQIVLNQCNDMHGLYKGTPKPPADCVVDRNRAANPGALIRRGDAAIAKAVDDIMAAPVWAKACNAAIVITWDEDN